MLVVDDEDTLRMIMVGRFEDYQDRFNVFTASNGKEAVKILESETIDLVVTDLKMPEMDGIELIAYMSANFPSTPTIAASAYCTPEIQAKLEGLGTLRVMDKPVNLDLLAQTVLKGLEQSHQGGSLSGISLSSFLQIIEMEEKSCMVEVHGEAQQRGFFYLIQGELHDAVCGQKNGEDAACEMVAWENVQLYLKDLPRKKPERRINKSLMSVVMEGLKRKDENQAQAQAETEEEKAFPAAEGSDAVTNEDTFIMEVDSALDVLGEAQALTPTAADTEDQKGAPGVAKTDPVLDDDTFILELDNVLDVLDENAEAAVPQSKDDDTPVMELDDVLEIPSKGAAPVASPKKSGGRQPVASEDAEHIAFQGNVFKMLHSELNSGELLRALIKQIRNIYPAEFAALLKEVKNEPGYLRIDDLVCHKKTTISRGAVYDCQNSPMAKVLKQKSPMVYPLNGSSTGKIEQTLQNDLGVRTCFIVPLLVEGRADGVLTLAATEESRDSNISRDFEWVAGGISLALERNRLSAGFAKQKTTLETVEQIGRAVASGDLDVEKLLKFSMKRIRAVVNVEAGSIYLKEKDQLKVAMAFNTKVDRNKHSRLTVGQGIAGHVAAKGKPLIINNAQKSSQFFREIYKQTGFKTRSVLCVPLVARKKVIGIVEVLNKIGGGFMPDDEAFLRSITASLSFALISIKMHKGGTPR